MQMGLCYYSCVYMNLRYMNVKNSSNQLHSNECVSGYVPSHFYNSKRSEKNVEGLLVDC